MNPSIRSEGGAEITRNLQKLRAAVRGQMIEEALLAGGEVIADEARRLVPVDKGNLRDSITVSTQALNYSAQSMGRAGEVVFIGPAHGRSLQHDGFYGHMVEFGTYRTVPEPFIRPAYDSKRREAVRIVGEHLSNALVRALGN